MNKLVLLFFISLIVLPVTLSHQSNQGNMTLLAVTEKGGSYEGSAADLFLSIRPGSGKVFIESFPLTKIDTQISTRFAKQVVCKQFEENCDDMDFFYTIRASAAIVGGPSAGASSAVLTLALLEDLPLDKSVGLTGTINSGGFIGPVGGIREKVEVAAETGLTTVLIPRGERFVDDGNISADMVEYGKELGINVVEVSDVRDALFYFTGKKFTRRNGNVSVDETYAAVMKELTSALCSRSENLRKLLSNLTRKEVISALDLTARSINASRAASYYSAASFCFGANIYFRYALLLESNYSDKELSALNNAVGNGTEEFEQTLNGYHTLTDLQSYSIVKERIDETREHLTRSQELLAGGNRDRAIYELGYAMERLYSAKTWSEFIGKGKLDMAFSKQALKSSCEKKLSEAEERYEYVLLFFSNALGGTREELDQAHLEFNNERFEMCLFKASKAKAEANTVLSVLGVRSEKVPDVVNQKLDATRESILEQTDKGLFPIVGYSYYEYANSLKGNDPSSALLFAEYALELSNLDIYFEQGNTSNTTRRLPEHEGQRELTKEFSLLLTGIAIGFVATVLLFVFLSKRKKKRVIIKCKSGKRKALNPGRAPKSPPGEKEVIIK